MTFKWVSNDFDVFFTSHELSQIWVCYFRQPKNKTAFRLQKARCAKPQTEIGQQKVKFTITRQKFKFDDVISTLENTFLYVFAVLCANISCIILLSSAFWRALEKRGLRIKIAIAWDGLLREIEGSSQRVSKSPLLPLTLWNKFGFL